MEKMPSASNSPVVGRKKSSEDAEVKKTQPLSVASMVRRFERDNGLDKSRGGGELERSNSSLNKIGGKSSPMSSRTSSLSSSQGHLASAEVEAASSNPEAAPSSEQINSSASTAASPVKKANTSSKTVSRYTFFFNIFQGGAYKESTHGWRVIKSKIR